MAGRTGTTDYLVVIDPENRYPAAGFMAAVTLISGGRMERRFALGRLAIVTVNTGAQHFTVIHGDNRDPFHHVVATVALIGGTDMQGVLANCDLAIMTGNTADQDLAVIHHQGG